VGHRPLSALLMWLLWLASAHTLLGMRCAHPDDGEMPALLMCAHCCGIYSSRKIAAAAARGEPGASPLRPRSTA